MATLSGCTIVRNAVKLNYPLRASIQTYLSICEEVVLAYDPTSEDETERLVFDLSKQYPKIRAIASTWDLANHDAGTEITIQSNVAIENCSCDWILYIQADEAIHEGDHQAIRNTLADTDLSGSLFERRSFLYTLDREMPEYFARNLLRLFRNGEGYAVGDAMSCALVQGVSGRISDAGWRMFNYSRIGDKEEILMRSRQRDSFYHSSEKAIEENQKRELTQRVKHFGLCSHPAPIREYYQQKPVITGRETSSPSLVTLVILMGKGELENIVPFLWQFRGWPGDIVVIDDMTTDTSAAIMHSTAAQILGAEENWIKIVRHSLSGNFSAARNLAHSLACADWVLHADLDERWDPKLIHILPQLLGQLDHDGKIICGFPRANFLVTTLRFGHRCEPEFVDCRQGTRPDLPPEKRSIGKDRNV